jgi:hypothetical protein
LPKRSEFSGAQSKHDGLYGLVLHLLQEDHLVELRNETQMTVPGVTGPVKAVRRAMRSLRECQRPARAAVEFVSARYSPPMSGGDDLTSRWMSRKAKPVLTVAW